MVLFNFFTGVSKVLEIFKRLYETKILFQETKFCFMKRKFVSTQLTKNIGLSLFSSIIYNYKCTTSHHKVIKDDASRKAMRIKVGFGSHSNLYILQFCYRTKT